MNFSLLIVPIYFSLFLEVQSALLLQRSYFKIIAIKKKVGLASEKSAHITLASLVIFFFLAALYLVAWIRTLTSWDFGEREGTFEVITQTPPSVGIPLGTPQPRSSRVLDHFPELGVPHTTRQLTPFGQF
jgi:hypothetical protein